METLKEKLCKGLVVLIPNRNFSGAVIDFSITPDGIKFIAITENRGVVICEETSTSWETTEYDVKKLAKSLKEVSKY